MSVMNVMVGMNSSWVIKYIMDLRGITTQYKQIWDNMLQNRKFNMKKIYDAMIDDNTRVTWRYLFKNNCARPRANHVAWLIFHGKLGTKNRLSHFGLIKENFSSLCKTDDESIRHLFFECRITNNIWKYILKWQEVNHVPGSWQDELNWVIKFTARNGWRVNMMKLALSETLGWGSTNLRDHIAKLMC
ncbi:unnamed protein product [Vicia faba]|uniref:Reverse transcriptase zinc-binding domain-containing protein n=1 Tax=Vicia faba TaxID=3906 RepID=A0AAV0Z5M2_VICFA|nr:unnamed protein product [Vicia faba]